MFAKNSQEQPEGAPRGRKRLLVLLVLLAAALVLGWRFWAAHKSSQTAVSTQDETLVTTEIVRTTITECTDGYGTLHPANVYNVTTLVAGDILEANFEEGDIVEEGQELYRLDNTDAKSALERARLAYNRAKRAYDKVADGKNVRAEIGGKVYSLAVREGQKVTTGQQVAVLRDSAEMLLTLSFPSAAAAEIAVGQAAVVTLDSTFEELPGRVWNVSGSDNIDASGIMTRTVVVAVPNPGALNSAMTATASVGGVGSLAAGTFQYKEEATVTAAANGIVAAVLAEEGQFVQENAVLFTLRGEELDEQIESAADSLRDVEITLENAEAMLESCVIVAPIRGSVVQKNYMAGTKAEVGKQLCVIYDMSYVEMNINVDELDVRNVHVGQRAEVTADAVPGRSYNGVITRVSVAGNNDSGAAVYPATVRIDEADGLLPGMNANARIVTSEAADVLAVPSSAVKRGNLVMITANSPSASRATKDMTAPAGYVYVEVELGLGDDESVEVLSGLQEGDVVAYTPGIHSDGYDWMYGGKN